MNAFTRSAATLLPRATGRRFASVRASAITEAETNGFAAFKKNWLQDAGAYPVMAILTFACAFCATVGTRCLATNTDVRINMQKRQQLVRTWN
eukprot:CAMPEP_0113537534 /NCGR_PEP_ID=MMETSP0015_2-20120614/6878_1 /TAXON_ID=2838 /ORGANISM="Odontella" /LENGTH=92 /DNA_ID=CAMNT_0000437037 /DNA_START=71 /DNA_END=349 /DNA_ORIENTATION=- /assembly_acc=CAM_ASM_000160